MFIDSTVPQPVPGAARTYSVTWPGVIQTRPATGTNVGQAPNMTRQGSQAPLGAITSAQQFTGVGSSITWGTNITATAYLGRAAVIFRPGTAAPPTGAVQQMDALVMTPTWGAKTDQTDSSATDDYACWRLVTVLSFQPQPSYVADNGVTAVCLNAGSYDIISGFASGFGFIQTADQEVSFVRRSVNAGGLLTKTPIISGVDLQKWRTYELRIIGATPAKNAILKVFVNGNIVLTLDWVTDALPSPVHSNGTYGFQVCGVAHCAGVGGGNAGFALNTASMMVGPTEASLL